MRIRAAANHILFKFTDVYSITSNTFTTYTQWGFSINGTHDQATMSPRWGELISAGPYVEKEIADSKYILITPLRWSNGMAWSYDGQENWIWRTDDKAIIGTADEL